MELPAQVLKVLWERYDYGGSEDMLKREVYPKMKDVAEFYSSYVTLGDDGYYHIIPTLVAEYYGWTAGMARNRDSTSALCMFKWQLLTTADAAGRLGVDKTLSQKWRAIAAKLAPYPMFMSDEGPMYSDVPGTNPLINKDYNWYPGFYPTILADEINLDSPEQAKAAMLRTAKLINGWQANLVPVLLGKAPGKDADFSQFQGVRQGDIYPETQLNSRSGRIHLWPAVEPNTTAAFRDYQARGGFLVSGERIKGETTYVGIRARRSETCTIMNPWPGKTVLVRDEGVKKAVKFRIDASNGEFIIFDAKAGHAYVIEKK
jgi:hypothetical protein